MQTTVGTSSPSPPSRESRGVVLLLTIIALVLALPAITVERQAAAAPVTVTTPLDYFLESVARRTSPNDHLLVLDDETRLVYDRASFQLVPRPLTLLAVDSQRMDVPLLTIYQRARDVHAQYVLAWNRQLAIPRSIHSWRFGAGTLMKVPA